jgi:hypothetical protein
MSQSICPYLGTLDNADNAAPPVDYPSFENQCFAIIIDEPLLLAEQAAVCLASGHRACPRFRMVQQMGTDEGEPAAASPGSLRQATLAAEMAHPFPLPDWAEVASAAKEGTLLGRRSWAWAGAAIIFMVMVLCGGIFAAYTGWQLASASYLTGRTGSVSTLSNPNLPGQAQTFMVVTATSVAANLSAQAEAATATLVVVPPTLTPVGVFPLAVTPTPVVINPAVTNLQPSTDSVANNPAGNPAQAITATQPIAQIGAPPDVTLPTPAIDLGVEIPTRRPTPIYDVPTSTPMPLEPTATATATPTPTPPLLGTPVVQFAPLLYTLESGRCTLLRWNVQNVREVYFENTGVPGIGEREVCVDDEDEVYRLAVILGDGSTKIYTATITYLPPTPTQTPTASFTPERNIEPTPTWTPDIPTATPTPPIILGTTLEVFGENHRVCAAGSDCEFDFLVTNSGNTPDTLLVTIVQSGPWQALICAEGGDCSTANLTLSNVNPGGTKLVKLKVSVASDATPQRASYALQSFSASSSGVSSGVTGVEVEVQ